MVTIGITGPSGAGKGAISGFLLNRGFAVINADDVYREVVSHPSPCLDELKQHFGDDVIACDGGLNRKILAERVFADGAADKLELLNKITHKYVVATIREMVRDYEARSCYVCAIDAPLLIEAGLTLDCDFTVAVLADKLIRAERISSRDGIDEERAMSRINAQKQDSFYISNCTYTVYNNSDIDSLETQIENILKDRSII